MRLPGKILFQTFVKLFYSENTGIFVFIFTMMFFIVSQQSGAGLYAYHSSLVIGMLSNNGFLLFIFFVWLLYARKCVAFVTNQLFKPEYSFIHIFNCYSKLKRFNLFLVVEVWLMLPILLYTLFIIFIGWQQHFYISLLFVISFLAVACITPALWYVYLLNSLQNIPLFPKRTFISISRLRPPYPFILVRFIAHKQKIIWAGIKFFTCGILYLTARNNSLTEPDATLAFLFFNFGILANGVIVYRIREFEESYLSFYRGLPVSSLKRMREYSLFYFIFLIPELITISILLPNHLKYADGINFMLCGYALMLLMNSISFLQNFTMKGFVKILLLIFCVQVIFLMTIGLTFLYVVLFIPAFAFFLPGYYKFDRSK